MFSALLMVGLAPLAFGSGDPADETDDDDAADAQEAEAEAGEVEDLLAYVEPQVDAALRPADPDTPSTPDGEDDDDVLGPTDPDIPSRPDGEDDDDVLSPVDPDTPTGGGPATWPGAPDGLGKPLPGCFGVVEPDPEMAEPESDGTWDKVLGWMSKLGALHEAPLPDAPEVAAPEDAPEEETPEEAAEPEPPLPEAEIRWAGDAPETIDDFRPGEDVLEVGVPPGPPGYEPVLSVKPGEDGSSTIVSLDGSPLAVLRGAPGVTHGDIVFRQIDGLAQG